MIRTVDISKWGTPYAYNIFDWNQIARPSPNWSGLAGGVLKGSSLGVLGQNDNNVEQLETVHVFGTCDFVEGDLVTQLQAQLGVPQTGYFDEDTCTGWYEQFGEKPTVASLTAALPAECGSARVPTCPALEDAPRGLSTASMVLIGGGVAAAAIYLMTRRR